MKNHKGFTLIEMLAVVMIIGILLIIAVPAISKYLNKGTVKYYNSLENSILVSGREYLNDYQTLLPREIGNVTVIELNELTSNHYIDDVKDSNGNICDGKITVKKTAKNKYEYYSCLLCNDYQTEGDNCEYTEDDNITSETKNYTIEVEKEKYIVNQGEAFELPLAKAYYLGQLVSSNIAGSPRIIDTNKLGAVTVNYSYQGAKKQVIVEVVDSISPSIPQIVLRYDNASGQLYTGKWYNGSIYAEFQSTDYTKPGLIGSGISYYEISTDGTTWQKLAKNNYLININGDLNYYVRCIDNAGNVSELNSFRVKIDTKIPGCKILGNGSEIINQWYSNNVSISLNVEETPSGIFQQTVSHDSVINNTTGEDVIATVTSNTGNVGTCSATVKIDKDDPTITAQNSVNYITTSTDSSILSYFSVSFGISGGNTVCKVNDKVVTNTNELELGVNTVTCTATANNKKTASATTTFKHQYAATAYCSGGRTLSNGTCTYYYSSNESQCGCSSWNSCQNSACGTTNYTCENEACGVASYNSCQNEAACGCAQYRCTLYKSCSTYLCSSNSLRFTSYNSCYMSCSEDCSGPSTGRYSVCGTETVYGSACNNASSKVCNSANSCQTAACGVASYKSCQTSACGSYINTCATSACGCAQASSCTKTENQYRYYQCDSTGNNGTNGTLSGTTCSF